MSPRKRSRFAGLVVVLAVVFGVTAGVVTTDSHTSAAAQKTLTLEWS